MCLCNIHSPIEFMNEISNEDQRDPIEDALSKELSRLDRRTFVAELAKRIAAEQLECEQKMLEMFPELVETIANSLAFGRLNNESAVDVLKRARLLQKGDLT
jgi:hypothetical protein